MPGWQPWDQQGAQAVEWCRKGPQTLSGQAGLAPGLSAWDETPNAALVNPHPTETQL